MTDRYENRLDKNNTKFNTLNPVWDNTKEDALNVFEMIDLLNTLNDENEQLKQVIKEFVENPIEHNLWKLRTVLKGDVE